MFMKKNYLPYAMWLIPLAFFAFQFILRLWPGLMMQEIMHQFSIDAEHFGLLAAFYYYGYASMQIPTAILLERFKTRFVLLGFALLCGLGTLMFTYTEHFTLAVLSRFLIGMGSAIGFLAVSKVVSQWFSKKQYPKLIGFSFSLGLLGAVYGGKPLAELINTYSGKEVGLMLSLVSMSIGLCALVFLKKPVAKESCQESGMILSEFAVLKKSKALWILALANFLMVGSLEGFADVWGVPFLMTASHFTKTDAAFLVSFIFIGMLFGGPILAYLSKKIGNYFVISTCGLGLSLIFILLLSSSLSQWWAFSLAFFTIGLLCCYQVLVFAAGAELVAPQYLTVTVAFLNCINMLGGSFFHTFIGKIMDQYWDGGLSDAGLRTYHLDAYTHALGLIPLCSAVGALVIYLLAFKRKRFIKALTIDIPKP